MFRKPVKDTNTHDHPPTPLTGKALMTVLGRGSTLSGKVMAEGGARIDGAFDGALTVKGLLVIGEGAKVIADISAETVSVAGAVKGNITARRVDILDTGRIFGDLIVESFTTAEGGFLRGTVRMGVSGEANATLPEDEAALFSVMPSLPAVA